MGRQGSKNRSAWAGSARAWSKPGGTGGGSDASRKDTPPPLPPLGFSFQLAQQELLWTAPAPSGRSLEPGPPLESDGKIKPTVKVQSNLYQS